MPASDSKANQTEAAEPRSLSEQIAENVEGVLSLQRCEWQLATPSQWRVVKLSRINGRPAYLVGILVFATLWIVAN
jgi:hypothetical protein